MSWREQASCIRAEPTMFDSPELADFDGGKLKPQSVLRLHEARRVCLACPVQLECLADALAAKDSGVRGGRLLDRGNPKVIPSIPKLEAVCGTEAAYRRHIRNGEPIDTECRKRLWVDARTLTSKARSARRARARQRAAEGKLSLVRYAKLDEATG